MSNKGSTGFTLSSILGRVLLGLAALLALAFAIDAGVLHYRVATNRNAFATVTVRPFYAVERKDKRVEYMYNDPEQQTCVNSVFPQLGDTPCWYLRRHTEQKLPD
jgi:hypothetical protein